MPADLIIVLGSPNDAHGRLHSVATERCEAALRLHRDNSPSRLLLTVCVVIQVYATLAMPDYAARIIYEGIVGSNQQSIYYNGRLMLLISLVGGVFMIGAGYLASRIATAFTIGS